MNRIVLAFRCFFKIIFQGRLSDSLVTALGLSWRSGAAAPAAPKSEAPAAPAAKSSDGALQILGILQRDSRLIDFLMEDIAGYGDDQVGAAVRSIHSDGKASLTRHVTLVPVIDGVEGTYQKLDGSKTPDPSRIKLVGNVPASGKVAGGTLRHRGWMASTVNLPPLGKQEPAILAPAELEVE